MSGHEKTRWRLAYQRACEGDEGYAFTRVL
jgi:hypothetical protein